MANLKLANGLSVQAEQFIESATAFLGKRGRGKSGGVKVIAEGLLKLGLPIIIFDPIGIHWGLKASFDGKKPSGLKVLVIGGDHADIPLDRKAGRLVARSIADANVSFVIDFKGTPHAAYREFVADLADELLNINNVSRLCIFEEAPRLVPQRLRPDQTVAFDAVQRLVLEGRNMGLGCLLVSQRAATLNKDVLTQVDNLVVMGITGPHDKKAVREWVENNDEDDEKLKQFLVGLSGLQPREAWLWSPEAGIFQKFRFLDFDTFHPDKTHLRKLGLLSTRPVLTDVAGLVEKLGSEMKGLAEKAKLDDPVALRKRIAQLEAASKTPAPAKEKVVEVPALSKEDRVTLKAVADAIVQRQAQEARDMQTMVRIEQDIRKLLRNDAAPRQARPAPVVHPKATSEVRLVVREFDGTLSRPQQALLDALAWLESVGIQEPRRSQLALAAEVSSKSSGFEKNVSTLSTRGLVTYPRDGHVTLTQDGRSRAHAPARPPTTLELQDSLCARLSGPQAKLLRTLIAWHPGDASRDALAAECDVSAKSSGFEKNISTLRSLGLIDYPADGMVRANDILFLELAR